MSAGGGLWYRFIRTLARLIFRALGGLDVEGEKNVPLSGPLIVSPTHLSHLDPPIVACAMPKRAIGFMAKEELFFGLFGKLITSLGAFPVKRGANDSSAIRTAIQRLKDGKAVLIFPEGTRGDGVTLGPISAGISMLAKSVDPLILPVAIIGTHQVLPKGAKKIRRNRMKVVIGVPFRYSEIAGAASDRENRQLFADYLAQKMVEASAQGGLPLKTSQTTSPRAESPTSGTSTSGTALEPVEHPVQP